MRGLACLARSERSWQLANSGWAGQACKQCPAWGRWAAILPCCSTLRPCRPSILPQNINTRTVGLQTALAMLSMPRDLGENPATGACRPHAFACCSDQLLLLRRRRRSCLGCSQVPVQQSKGARGMRAPRRPATHPAGWRCNAAALAPLLQGSPCWSPWASLVPSCAAEPPRVPSPRWVLPIKAGFLGCLSCLVTFQLRERRQVLVPG